QSEKLGQWSSERPLQTQTPPPPLPPPSSFLHCNSFNSLSSSKQSIKSQSSFMEMMKSGRGLQEEEEDDDDEYANSSKKSSSSQKDGKSGDQKANTPRSKHSATEQRRRSKINDRFQILRDLIPQNDQKRDKASFLLEVIEYIQFLQEKVNRYEVSYQGWNQEPTKLTPWTLTRYPSLKQRNGHAPGESMADHSQTLKSGPGPTLMFTGKFDDNIIANPTILATTPNPVDPCLSTSTTYKTMDHHAEGTQKSGSVPIPLQPNIFPPAVQRHPKSISEAENLVPQSQLWPIRPCKTQCPDASDTLNEHDDLTIEGGTISLAGVYSQGLLNNLTQALQSSGVDLSQASVSVQVDIGKRATNRLNAMASGSKDDGNPSSNRTMAHSRVESSGEDSDQARKRLRTE
ncbi:Transcription factor bim2, partial [Thalictrum thalictroides]